MNVALLASLIKIAAIAAIVFFGWKHLLGGFRPGTKHRANDKQSSGVQLLEGAALVSLYAGMTRVVADQLLATIYLGGFCVLLLINPRAFRVLLGGISAVFALAFFDLGETTLLGYLIIILFVAGRLVLGERPEPWRRS